MGIELAESEDQLEVTVHAVASILQVEHKEAAQIMESSMPENMDVEEHEELLTCAEQEAAVSKEDYEDVASHVNRVASNRVFECGMRQTLRNLGGKKLAAPKRKPVMNFGTAHCSRRS